MCSGVTSSPKIWWFFDESMHMLVAKNHFGASIFLKVVIGWNMLVLPFCPEIPTTMPLAGE